MLADTKRLPYSLCRVDKLFNLRELGAGCIPDEPVAAQLWELMRRGFSIDLLAEVLGEIEGLSWSSIGVEQAHAGAAQVMRHHPDFHEESMMSRAFLYTARAL